MSANTLNGLSSLQGLWLNMNRLISLSPNTFNGLNSLKGLWLNDNMLQVLGSNTFSGLNGGLEGLGLINNNLTSLSQDVFKPILKSQTVLHVFINNNPIASQNNTYLLTLCNNSFEINGSCYWNTTSGNKKMNEFYFFEKPLM